MHPEFRSSPNLVGFSRVAWEWFVPFLQFPPPARRVLYTTHSIESLNAELRKATRNRHQFPNDIAALKTLWLIICTIEDKRALPNARRKPNAILRATDILKEPNQQLETSHQPTSSGLPQPIRTVLINQARHTQTIRHSRSKASSARCLKLHELHLARQI